MKAITLSVIIPVYNAERYLRQCLDSVLSQDVDGMEVVIVDDGSTDGSPAICRAYAEANSSVRYLRKDNGGVSSARNMGIVQARGKYITFVDSDDEVLVGAYHKMLKAFDDVNTDLVCCGIFRRAGDGHEIGTHGVLPAPIRLDGKQAMVSCLEQGPVGFTVYAKIFRTSLFVSAKPVRFPEGRLMEEAYVLPSIFAGCRGIVHIGEAGYAYFNRENSYTTKPLSTECYAIYDTSNRYEHLLPSLFPGFDMTHLYRWQVRQATYVYRKALYERHIVSAEVMRRVRMEFHKFFPEALWSRDIDLRMKAMMLDTVSRCFLGRKTLLAAIHGKDA